MATRSSHSLHGTYEARGAQRFVSAPSAPAGARRESDDRTPANVGSISSEVRAAARITADGVAPALPISNRRGTIWMSGTGATALSAVLAALVSVFSGPTDKARSVTQQSDFAHITTVQLPEAAVQPASVVLQSAAGQSKAPFII